MSCLVDQEGKGFSLRLQEASGEAWAFFQWPDRRLYGFVSFDAWKGEARVGTVTSGTGKSSTLTMKVGVKGNGSSLAFSGPGLPVGEIALVSSITGETPRLSGFSARGGGGFHLDLISDSSHQSFPFLDARLRRGESPLTYARELLGRTEAGQVLRERQYLLSAGERALSIATERRLSAIKGREDNYFRFDSFDPVSGKVITVDSLLGPGWKKFVTPLLEREAKRVVDQGGGNKGPEGVNAYKGLRSYGLFEDAIEPPMGFFLCESGLGFHYDRYELGPYSLGDFTFVVPWFEVASLIKKEGGAPGFPF